MSVTTTNTATGWTGKRIRALRKQFGYTQKQMADALGYAHLSRISELEHEVMTPSNTVCKLLDHLDQRGDLPREGEA